MGYNYCLAITKKEVVGLVLEVLKKEKWKVGKQPCIYTPSTMEKDNENRWN